MRKLLFVALMFCAITVSAQKKAIPDYLMGSTFPDSTRALSLKTLDGQMTDFGAVLNKYQGKTIVVDIWATWCKDCIFSLPELKKLYADSEGKDIVFVMLSLDRAEQKWIDGVAKYEFPGDHYFVPAGWKNPLSNFIVLDWIPRYMVIDTKGKVVSPKTVKIKDLVADSKLLQ